MAQGLGVGVLKGLPFAQALCLSCKSLCFVRAEALTPVEREKSENTLSSAGLEQDLV